MIRQILDLHIHSKYARACSPLLELPNIAKACEIKGIDICSTGDFTHPLWMEHIKENLEEMGQSGLYRLKNSNSKTKFILATEISCVYKHKNKTRRLHLLVVAPNIAAAEKFNAELTARGANLRSDGRPIMGIPAKTILEIMLAIHKDFMLIPAHAWTPWFAVFGSKSGYDSLEECFEELSSHVKAIETGLSSDPVMNRSISKLDGITLISNSDAHSLENLGREANVLSFASDSQINYKNIKRIIEDGKKEEFLYTIEFYPEEGMYYADGHRDCGVSMTPKETKKNKKICPKCKKEMTVGVLFRVDELSDREIDDLPKNKFVPHKYIVPLREIIAEAFGVGKSSKKVIKEYNDLITKIGSEFHILLDADFKKIESSVSDNNVYIGIRNMRSGKVSVVPGFDGQYGKVMVIIDRVGSLRQKTLI